ncbi:phospholipase A2 [Streptomyces sp. NPDC004044]
MKSFGVPFANSCVRHDFGYRNDTAPGTFGGGKARVESAFCAGLERGCAVCAGREGLLRRDGLCLLPGRRQACPHDSGRHRVTLAEVVPVRGVTAWEQVVPLVGVVGRAVSQRYAWATRQYTEKEIPLNPGVLPYAGSRREVSDG